MTIEEFYKRFDFNSDASGSIIGRGGFGVVYKAYDKVRKRFVAIKRSEVGQFAKFELKREVEIANEIDPHINILRYENIFRISEHLNTYDYAVMKYYPEGNLENVLRKNQLTDKEQKDILTGILNGLAHIHAIPIIHRDFKTANILMDKTPGGDWLPLICDFGQSRLVDNDNSMVSNNSQIALTPKYSAPEQLLDTRELRTNADLWAFGVITYQMIQGKLPFKVDEDGVGKWGSSDKIRFLILQGDLPKDIEEIRQPYREIIKQCLVTDPAKRVKSANDLLKLLDNKPVKNKKPEPDPDTTKVIIKPPVIVQPDEEHTVILEEEVEEKREIKPDNPAGNKNKVKWLAYIFAGAALLAVTYFLISLNSEPKPITVVPAPPEPIADTTSNKKAEKTTEKDNTGKDKKPSSGTSPQPPVDDKPPVEKPHPRTGKGDGILSITANEACEISIDGKSYGKWAQYETKNISLNGTDPKGYKAYIVIATNNQGVTKQKIPSVYAGSTKPITFDF